MTNAPAAATIARLDLHDCPEGIILRNAEPDRGVERTFFRRLRLHLVELMVVIGIISVLICRLLKSCNVAEAAVPKHSAITVAHDFVYRFIPRPSRRR
jgi:hypothetical protein